MKKHQSRLVFPLIISILFIITSCSSIQTFRTDQNSDTYLQNLIIYTSHPYEIYTPIIKEFEERTGVWVTVVTGGSNELLLRIENESAAPQCDILFGGGIDSHASAIDYLESYAPAGIETVNSAYRLNGNRSTPFSILPIVIIYNTKLVPQAQAPKGWADLLDAQWTGRIAFTDPQQSASCFTALTIMIQVLEGTPQNIISGFAANVGRMLNSSSLIASAVIDGQCAIGVVTEQAAQTLLKEGQDIAVVYPVEGTAMVPDATSLIKNAPHPDIAKEFIDFSISRDVQFLLSEQLERRPVIQDMPSPRNLPPTDAFTIIDYNYQWSESWREQLLTAWAREF